MPQERDGEDWRDYSQTSLPPVLQAALECFAETGYHGTSMRTLAARAGLSIPGVYYHHASKQAVLVALMEIAMEDLYRRSLAALGGPEDDPVAQLDRHVECLVLYHAYRGPLAFVAASEIRALEPAARTRIVAARDRQQRILQDIVDRGRAEGRLVLPHPDDAVRALVTMCTAVSQWYRPGGTMTPDVLAARYRELARRLLGVGARRSG